MDRFVKRPNLLKPRSVAPNPFYATAGFVSAAAAASAAPLPPPPPPPAPALLAPKQIVAATATATRKNSASGGGDRKATTSSLVAPSHKKSPHPQLLATSKPTAASTPRLPESIEDVEMLMDVKSAESASLAPPVSVQSAAGSASAAAAAPSAADSGAQSSAPLSAFDHELSDEQRAVLAAVRTGKSVFFTGAAGSGKSYLLTAIVKALKSQTLYVTASTGMAALNISGQTIHSFAGIGFGDGDTQTLITKIKRNRQAKQRWTTTQVLIIDVCTCASASLATRHLLTSIR